jgi:hypothetical protein
MKKLILILAIAAIGCNDDEPARIDGRWESTAPLHVFIEIQKNGDYTVPTASLINTSGEFAATAELIHRGAGESIDRLYLSGDGFRLRIHGIKSASGGNAIIAESIDYVTSADSTRVTNLLFTKAN